MFSIELLGGFPLNIEWNDAAQEYRIRGRKGDGQLSNVGLYVKAQGNGVVFARGEIEAALQGNPFFLDSANRITNIGL